MLPCTVASLLNLRESRAESPATYTLKGMDDDVRRCAGRRVGGGNVPHKLSMRLMTAAHHMQPCSFVSDNPRASSVLFFAVRFRGEIVFAEKGPRPRRGDIIFS